MAISLAGLSISATGCSKPTEKDKTALESLPPQLANCPDLPELKNIVLKDGKVADVRIVQFRETKLYFPTRWLKKNIFVDKRERNHSGSVKKEQLGLFTPGIQSVECPGIIHHIADEKSHINGVFSLVRLNIAARFNSINITSSDLWAIDFGLNPQSMTPHVQFVLGTTQNIEFSNDIIIRLHNDGPLERGVAYESQSVLDLTKWLMMPPAQRDNDRKFMLKIDRVTKL